nr:hypothetical protein [Candidatus Sigynarchaeota archaeon]
MNKHYQLIYLAAVIALLSMAACMVAGSASTRPTESPGDEIAPGVRFAWNVQWGMAEQCDWCYDVCSDGTDIYACGTVNWTYEGGKWQFALAKLTSDGDIVWMQSWGDPAAYCVLRVMTADAMGVYFMEVWYYSGNSTCIYALTKWNPDATEAWRVVLDGDHYIDNIVAAQGAVYACGSSSGMLEVSKYDAATGSLLWNQTSGSCAPMSALYHVSADNAGVPWVIGSNLTGQLHVSWWNSTQEPTYFNNSLQPTSTDMGGCGIWVDEDDVYACGGARNTSSSYPGNIMPVLVKFAKNGTIAWNRTIAWPMYEISGMTGRHLASDSEIYIVGPNELVYPNITGNLACFGSDGIQKWNVTVPGTTSFYTPYSVYATDKALYIAANDGNQMSVVKLDLPGSGGGLSPVELAIIIGVIAAVALVVPAVVIASKRHSKSGSSGGRSRPSPAGLGEKACPGCGRILLNPDATSCPYCSRQL